MVSSGFYNSLDGDRKYNATHFSNLFEGIISDGIFGSIYNAFATTAETPNSSYVLVDTGKAWFQNTWTLNDTILKVGPFSAVTVSSRSRIDAVVIQVDKLNRENTITIVEGTAAANPSRPTLAANQFPIAFVTCSYNSGNAPIISATNINWVVGQSDYGVPYITTAMQTMNISALTAKWEAIFNEWFSTMQELPADSAAYLAQKIDNLIVAGSEPLTDASQLGNSILYVQYEE